jgi:hypothetical protein
MTGARFTPIGVRRGARSLHHHPQVLELLVGLTLDRARALQRGLRREQRVVLDRSRRMPPQILQRAWCLMSHEQMRPARCASSRRIARAISGIARSAMRRTSEALAAGSQRGLNLVEVLAAMFTATGKDRAAGVVGIHPVQG